jgi:hypothetical protein
VQAVRVNDPDAATGALSPHAPSGRRHWENAMNALRTCAALVAVVCLLAACEKRAAESGYAGIGRAPAKPEAAASAAGGERQRAMLAYEHTVEIRLPADRIVPRLRAARAACDTSKFGECVVLDVGEQGGDFPSGSLTVRIEPRGVEPMIALAGAGAELGSRSTHAEDLAVVVRDNDLAQARLRKERERLEAFAQRQDLAVADMIALSKQLADTQAQLEAAEQEGAQHRRRIDTQLLTLNFEPPSGESGRGEIGQAVRDFGATLSSGAAFTIRALAFLIPVALLLIVLVWAIRRARLRRNKT